MDKLLDTHYHFDFVEMNNREEFLTELETTNIDIVAQTVMPSGYKSLFQTLSQRLSLGFHPWWITSAEQVAKELAIFAEYVSTTRFIGEVGLDFSPKCLAVAERELQIQTFAEVLDLVVEQARGSKEPYILSIHAVRAVIDVLELLESKITPEANVRVILHYFSGTSDELMRHIKNGGYLSVNPKMLESKKGRAYVCQVPRERLLLETDLPASDSLVVKNVSEHIQDMQTALEQTVTQLSYLRNEAMYEQIIQNQQAMYGDSY